MTIFPKSGKWLMMVNQTGDGVKRHITSRIVLHVNIAEKLVSEIVRNSEDTVDSGGVLMDPGVRQSRHLGVIISQMPNIQGLGITRAHLAGDTGRLVAVIGPRFLITKDFVILGVTLSIDFLVQHSLLTNVGKLGPVIVKHGLPTPKTLNALLIGVVITGNHNTDHKAMLNKALSKIGMNVGSERHSTSITERRRTGNGPGILNNLVNRYRNTVTAKILRALKASIRGSNSKMGLEGLNIAGTTSGTPLIKFLDLESGAELIDGSNRDSVIKLSPEISRVTDNTIINGRIQIRITSIRKPIRTTERIPIDRASMIASLKITITPRNINIVRIIKQILRNRLIHRYNRRIAKLSGIDGHVRALLRTGETAGEIITELIGNKGLATFSNVRNIVTSIHALDGSIIHRNIKRVSEIFTTKPLIHNEGIGAERKGRNREAFHTSRDAHIVGQGSDFPTIGGGGQLGDLILNLRDPSGFSIFAHELFPVFPYQAVGNKEIIRIKIDVIHDRSQKGLHTDNLRRANLERITGKNLINVKGNHLASVEGSLMRKITGELGTRHIQTNRVSSKTRVSVSTHYLTSLSAGLAICASGGFWSGVEGLVGSCSGDIGL